MSFPSCEIHPVCWGVCPVCMVVVPYQPSVHALCGWQGARYARHAYRSEYTGQPDEQGGCLRCGAKELGEEVADTLPAIPVELVQLSPEEQRFMRYRLYAYGAPTIRYPRGYLTGKDIGE